MAAAAAAASGSTAGTAGRQARLATPPAIHPPPPSPPPSRLVRGWRRQRVRGGLKLRSQRPRRSDVRGCRHRDVATAPGALEGLGGLDDGIQVGACRVQLALLICGRAAGRAGPSPPPRRGPCRCRRAPRRGRRGDGRALHAPRGKHEGGGGGGLPPAAVVDAGGGRTAVRAVGRARSIAGAADKRASGGGESQGGWAASAVRLVHPQGRGASESGGAPPGARAAHRERPWAAGSTTGGGSTHRGTGAHVERGSADADTPPRRPRRRPAARPRRGPPPARRAGWAPPPRRWGPPPPTPAGGCRRRRRPARPPRG